MGSINVLASLDLPDVCINVMRCWIDQKRHHFVILCFSVQCDKLLLFMPPLGLVCLTVCEVKDLWVSQVLTFTAWETIASQRLCGYSKLNYLHTVHPYACLNAVNLHHALSLLSPGWVDKHCFPFITSWIEQRYILIGELHFLFES